MLKRNYNNLYLDFILPGRFPSIPAPRSSANKTSYVAQGKNFTGAQAIF